MAKMENIKPVDWLVLSIFALIIFLCVGFWVMIYSFNPSLVPRVWLWTCVLILIAGIYLFRNKKQKGGW